MAAAVNRPVKLTFPEGLIIEPLIYQLGHKFKIVTSIRRADIREDIGWVVLELEGEADEINAGLEWLSSKGVRVDPVSGDVVEG